MAFHFLLGDIMSKFIVVYEVTGKVATDEVTADRMDEYGNNVVFKDITGNTIGVYNNVCSAKKIEKNNEK